MPNYTKIRLKLDEVNVDRTQYKPYSHTLIADLPEVFVEIDVPTTFVVAANKDKIVLNVNGLAAMLGSVADAIDAMNEKHRIKTYGH